ncbi:hypothetical protein MRX96_019239 [Rhipicephalus microplus]
MPGEGNWTAASAFYRRHPSGPRLSVAVCVVVLAAFAAAAARRGLNMERAARAPRPLPAGLARQRGGRCQRQAAMAAGVRDSDRRGRLRRSCLAAPPSCSYRVTPSPKKTRTELPLVDSRNGHARCAASARRRSGAASHRSGRLIARGERTRGVAVYPRAT